MSFWSGERLALELANGLISDFNPDNIDCATYRLCVGTQAFVTADKFGKSAPNEPLISVLGEAPTHTLRIPPGQFAFLLTHETVHVPATAIALISMRASYKFKGLINVSGFHVDPGWRGKLLFSVYNAGASEVIIRKMDQLFMIVYADLDQATSKVYRGKSQNQTEIDPSLLAGMTGQVFSPLMLQRKMDALQDKATRIQIVTSVVTIVVTLLLAFVAVIATFAPTALGVVLARTIEGAGYELKLKASEISTPSPGKTSAKIEVSPPTISPKSK